MSWNQRKLPEGAFTQTIYSLIRDHKYAEAIGHLNLELQVGRGQPSTSQQ
jgi:hypothetical protein